MKIGIVSDIHCNIEGLRRALDSMGAVDELICAGDAIFQYRFSNEVVEELRERGARVILGNHEETFFSVDGDRARAAPSVNRELVSWLAEKPLMLETRANGKRLVVAHGSPWSPHREYLYPSSPALYRFNDFDADYVILGHTHYQMTQRFGRTLVINPGSTGDARDPRNGSRLSFAVLDTASDEVQFCNYTDPNRPLASSAAPVWTVGAADGGEHGRFTAG